MKMFVCYFSKNIGANKFPIFICRASKVQFRSLIFFCSFFCFIVIFFFPIHIAKVSLTMCSFIGIRIGKKIQDAKKISEIDTSGCQTAASFSKGAPIKPLRYTLTWWKTYGNLQIGGVSICFHVMMTGKRPPSQGVHLGRGMKQSSLVIRIE
jgi:hypothetical protein